MRPQMVPGRVLRLPLHLLQGPLEVPDDRIFLVELVEHLEVTRMRPLDRMQR